MNLIRLGCLAVLMGMGSIALADPVVKLAGIEVMDLSVSPDKAGKPSLGLSVAGFLPGKVFSVHSLGFSRRTAWIYRIRGGSESATAFPASALTITDGYYQPVPIKIVGGNVTIDRRAKSVTIALRVQAGHSEEPFKGNGTYPYKLRPGQTLMP